MAKEVKMNITKFLGLWHDNAGDTAIPNGALSQMQNFQILNGYKLRKRSGYSSIIAEPFTTPIRGQWYGKLDNRLFHVVVTGGHAYVVDSKDKIEIGELDDAKTTMFQFGDVLYMQNGVNYYKFTGEEVVNPSEVNFNSVEQSTYPHTVSLPAGKYEFELGGGKGKDYERIQNGQKYLVSGGKGGKIKFRAEFANAVNVRIEKITTGTEYGVSYWVYVDDVLYAAVGGGGNAYSWYHETYGEHSGKVGGDGGGDIASGGTDLEDGKGATGSVGGSGGGFTNYGYGTGKAGGSGKSYDDLTDKGKGGLGANGVANGGCGYAGGGGGGYSYTSWGVRRGSGGGGTSYVIDSGIILAENSKGTNNGTGFAKITTVRPYGLLFPVDGYIPKTYAGTKPDGTNGTKLEPINTLTGKRRQLFNGDNTATVYKLAEKSNISVDKVLVGGVEKTVTTHYTVNATKDEVTFTSGNVPPTGINNVEIYYTHDNNTDRAEAVKYTHARIYGGKNDNRVFLYGNGNRVIFSDLADGVPSAEYFPVFNTMDIGSPQYDVTGLSVQYDRMLIHKERGTWWTNYDYDSTLMTANFPVYPLNDNVGVSYKGTEQIIENNPFVLMNKQLWQFVASNVRDERNVQYMSEKVETLLEQLDFAYVMTLDYEKFGEYWIILDNRVYIYNYRLGVWYYYYLADNVTAVCIKDNQVVLGTDTGNLLAMDGSLDDNGELINAYAETGWLDYGYSNMRKFLNFMWVQIFPESNTSAEIYYQIDRWKPVEVDGVLYNVLKIPSLVIDPSYTNVELVKQIGYNNIDFANIDFSDFSFLTNYNPKSIRLKPKAKKFVYVKFTFINNERTKLTVLGFNAPALLGGRSK